MLLLPYPMCCENGKPDGPCPQCSKEGYLGYWFGALVDADFDENGKLIGGNKDGSRS